MNHDILKTVIFGQQEVIEKAPIVARRYNPTPMSGKRVFITGSNAAMLSSQIATTLGGRFVTQCAGPRCFDECLDAVGQKRDARALLATNEVGKILGRCEEFYRFGGFPESLRYASPEITSSAFTKRSCWAMLRHARGVTTSRPCAFL